MAITGLWSRLQGAVVGVAVGTAMADVLAPIFEPLKQESWRDNPNRVLAIGQLAELVSLGVVEFGPAVEHARRSGYDVNAFRALVEGQLQPPSLGLAMDAFRRDAITEGQYRHALTKSGIEGQYHDALVSLRAVLPSVTDLVRMAVREVFNPAQRAFLDLDAEYPDALTDAGERIGLSRSTLGNYWAAHWELPSYTQLTEMRFRGLLSVEQYRDALKAIDLAPVWRDKMFEIARRIPTPTEMVRFAVREVYNPSLRQLLGYEEEYPEAFTAQAALHGISEEHARQYWWAHWRLPSARQGYDMLARGLITPAELDALLKALDYPAPWRPRLAAIAHLVPGRIDLKRMYRFGILDRAQVKAGYMRLRYTAEDAEHLTQIAEAEAEAALTGSSWIGRAKTSAFGRLHTEFVSRQVSEGEVAPALSLIGVPAGEVGRILDLWNIEAAFVRTELTQAQIVKAARKGLITAPEAIAELEERGMTTSDAQKRLEL